RYRVLNSLVAANLSPGLDDLLVLSGGLDHAPAFGHVVTDRLLDIHILARLNGPDRGQCMPVVRGRHRDRVDVPVVEQLADVLIVLGRSTVEFLDLPLRRADRVLVDVADGRDANVFLLAEALDVVHAAAVYADDGDS